MNTTTADWAAVERFHVHDGQRVLLASYADCDPNHFWVVDPGYALDSPLRRFGPFTEERALEIAACHASFGAVQLTGLVCPNGEDDPYQTCPACCRDDADVRRFENDHDEGRV